MDLLCATDFPIVTYRGKQITYEHRRCEKIRERKYSCLTVVYNWCLQIGGIGEFISNAFFWQQKKIIKSRGKSLFV